MNKNLNSISIVIAALNEEKVVREVVSDIYREVSKCFEDFEILLIDDGSTDSTGKIFEELSRKFKHITFIVNTKNLGLGESFKVGIKRSRSQYVMLLCGDGGLPASSLPDIFAKVGSKDLIIPFMINLKQIKSKFRFRLSRTYTSLLNFIFRLKINYYNGLPVYPRELLNKIEISNGGFGFQAEILITLIKSGCSYEQIGVQGAEHKGTSKALTLRNLAEIILTFIQLVQRISKSNVLTADAILEFRSNIKKSN